jgi:hypothetical protein
MAELKILLEKKYPSQIYWFDTPEGVTDVVQLAKDFHFYLMYLDGTKINTGVQYLDVIREVTQCPYMVGDNWNAVLDAMRDFEWLPDYQGYIFFYDDVQFFAKNEPHFFDVSLETLRDTAESWRDGLRNGKPMYILLRGHVEIMSKLESLPKLNRELL